jgi:hypothetical protein
MEIERGAVTWKTDAPIRILINLPDHDHVHPLSLLSFPPSLPLPIYLKTHAVLFSTSDNLFFSFAAFSRLPSSASIPIPPKTQATPTHCMKPSECPNHTTEMIIVSILRVTVMVTRKREPKIERV